MFFADKCPNISCYIFGGTNPELPDVKKKKEF